MRALPTPMTPKEARYHRVGQAVISVLLAEGPDGLRYAAVARRAKVSRPWIYAQFGKDPAALQTFVVRLFGDLFAELHRSNAAPDVAVWRANLVAATRRGVEDTAEAPWIMSLWFRYRHHPGPFGVALRDLEARHLDKFIADMPERLRKRSDARAFALTFAAARQGVYHLCIDPGVRRAIPDEALCRPLDAMIEAFAS